MSYLRKPFVTNGENQAFNGTTNVQTFASVSSYGVCTLCKKCANLVCQRCGDYYCSMQCQRSDWKAHRPICIPMPVLVKASDFFGVNENTPQLGGAEEFAQQEQHQQKAGLTDVKIPLGDHVQTQMQPLQQRDKPQEEQQQRNTANMQPQQQPQWSMESMLQQQMQQQNNRYVPQQKPNFERGNPRKIANIVLPKKGSTVCVTGFQSSNRVYARSLNPDDDSAYTSILRHVDEYGKKATALADAPRTHDHVITIYNGAMHRGTVHYIRNAMTIRILLSDVGLVVNRHLGELREIDEHCKNLPHYAVMFHLRKVPVQQYIDETFKDFLINLNGKYTIQFEKEPAEGAQILLMREGSDKTLNQLVCEYLANAHKNSGILRKSPSHKNPFKTDIVPNNNTCEIISPEKTNARPQTKSIDTTENTIAESPAEWSSGAKSTENSQGVKLLPVLEQPYKTIVLPEKATNLKVVVLDTSAINMGYIACIKKEDEHDLKRMTLFIRNLKLGRYPEYTPQLNEYCMAQYDGEWFRAKVIEVSGSNFTVNYVDFTNTGVLTSAEIRRYPACLKTPCKTSLCLLNNCPATLEQKHIDILEKHFAEHTDITIDQVVECDMEDNPPVVLIDYFEAVKILRE